MASKVTVIDNEVIASGPTMEVLTEPMMHGNFRGIAAQIPQDTGTGNAEGAIV